MSVTGWSPRLSRKCIVIRCYPGEGVEGLLIRAGLSGGGANKSCRRTMEEKEQYWN